MQSDPIIFSKIGLGFFLVTQSRRFENDKPLVATKLADQFWGLFELAASDLVSLRRASKWFGNASPRIAQVHLCWQHPQWVRHRF